MVPGNGAINLIHSFYTLILTASAQQISCSIEGSNPQRPVKSKLANKSVYILKQVKSVLKSVLDLTSEIVGLRKV